LNKNNIVIIAIIFIISILITGCNLVSPLASVNSGNTSGMPGNGVLNLADIDPTTLDPALSTETTSAQYIMEIFTGLLKLDDNMQPVPDIAASMPTVSSDGLTYTFSLRQDIKFQDGNGVTANDIKYSWERAANPTTGSQTAATYLGDIVGVNDELSGATSQINGVKVIDNYTLQVTIDSPKSYFLYKLTYPTTFVVDKNNVSSGQNWWRKPNGTGPFKLGQWVQGQSLTLLRNDLFYGDKPQLSQIKYQYYSGLPMDLFETGQIDATGVSTSYKDAVTDISGPFYQNLSVTPALGVYYIGFNCNQPPFDDVNVRKAFNMAVDKDKIITLVFRDMQQKANGILPPGMPGYNQNLVGLNYDENQAKNLIKASKYGDVSKLPSITLTTYGYGGSAGPVLQSLVYQWKLNLGVDVKIRELEPERYFYNTKAEVDQMFDTAWAADYPHPQDFLDILFHSGSSYNYGNYSNSEVDSLIQQANRTADQQQSFTLYQEAEQLIVNDAACIPISFSENYTVVQPYVKGYTINALGFATLNKVIITPH
jgi:oligopeptide transport system substrate-binding protein